MADKHNYLCSISSVRLLIYVWLAILSSNAELTDVLSRHSFLQGHSSNVLSSYRCPLDNEPKKKLVCFYRVEDEYRPYDLDPCLCTHIVYSYVAVKENFAFIAGKKGDLKYLSALRNKNPLVKIIVSLRPTGPSFSLEDPKNITYPLPASNTLRHRFAKRIRDFVNRHSLDGVDIDYEYFKQENDSNALKRQYLISIIQSISESLKSNDQDNKTLLTLTTSRYPKHLADYYDFAEINKFVDFVNIPAFNFDQEGNTLIHPAKLHGMSEMENMDAIIDLAMALGLPSNQLVIGIPTFGTLYRVANQSQTTPGSEAISWISNNQPITTISHSKICDVRDKANWTLVREKDLTAPYIYNGDKWIGFDDEISVKLKAKYLVLRRAAGMAFFHLNDDDFQNQCGLGPYPLLRSALFVFQQAADDVNLKIHPIAFFNTSQQYFTSFLDVVQKYGNVERITEDDEDQSDVTLPCNHNGYIRHPEDCTRFYRCLKLTKNDQLTQKFQYSCPPGLVFDEYFQICNWPSWSPPCLGSGEIASTMKSNFVCSKPGFYQDPDNCEYFHYCSDLGKTYLQAYQFKCPFELGYDQAKMQCNWKWLVKGCQYVPPEERIVKDLHQILPQDVVGEDKDEHIEPAASDISAILQDVFRAQQNSDHGDEMMTMDEFEERSDHDPLEALHSQLDPVHLPASGSEENSKTTLTKRFSLNLPKIEEIYKRNPAYMARLQAITNYISVFMSRFRLPFWNKLSQPPKLATSSSSQIQSRADDHKNVGKPWFGKSFNMPKIPKLTLKKPRSVMMTKKRKSSTLETEETRSKKRVFDKSSFKVPKLHKFSKRKRIVAEKPSNKRSQTQSQSSSQFNSNFMNSQMVPMFVEESVQIPQFVQAPPRNINLRTSIKQQSSNPFMQAESAIKPISISMPLSGSHNQFNFKPNRFQESNGNLLNDYRVASSFATINAHHFAQPHLHSMNSKTDHVKHLVNVAPGQTVSNGNRQQQQQQQQSSSSSSSSSSSTTTSNYQSKNDHFSKQIKASESVNTFNIQHPPASPLVLMSSDAKPFQHSYGLPSVNIRYSYFKNEHNQPITTPKPRPTLPPPPPPPPPKVELPVRIEATKINFPDSVLSEEDVNSADLQLENFLRDKFISSLNLNNQPLTVPENVPRPKIQTTTTRTPPTTIVQHVRQHNVRVQQQAPKFSTNQILHHGPILTSFQLNNAGVTNLPLTLNPLKPSINFQQHQVVHQAPRPNNVNKFSNFVASTDMFSNERDKIFKDSQPPKSSQQHSQHPQHQVQQHRPIPPKQQPIIRPATIRTTERPRTTPRPVVTVTKSKPAVLATPKAPTVNYKLTPITDSVFEINNKTPIISNQPSLVENSHNNNNNMGGGASQVPKEPSVHGLFDNYEPHIALHNADRFELVRSTAKPQITFDSYEWTTPSSLKDNKLQVNFNLMSAKDIEDEINKKKHMFKDQIKPIEQPLPFHKHNFFPPLGDPFENYAGTTPENRLKPQSVSDGNVPETSLFTINDVSKSTTPVPWFSTESIDANLSHSLNDTNEYIMLMLNKDHPGHFDQHLAELIQHGQNLGKIYNVETDHGSQTILALLPTRPHLPFVYKGENALLKNLSIFEQNFRSPNEQIHKLDISKPDSQILHSIFDRFKDELQASDKLLPYGIDDGIDLSSISMHQARRIPQPQAAASPSSIPDRYARPYYNNDLPKMTKAPNYRTTTTTTTLKTTTTTTTVTPPITTAALRHFKQEQPSWQPTPPSIDYDQRLLNYQNNQRQTNRSSNIWYQDVGRITEDSIDPANHKQPDKAHTSEEAKPVARTIPSTAFTRSTVFTDPPTTTTTTSTTSTTSTESTILYHIPTQRPLQRKNQPRRRPDFGNRQRLDKSQRQPQSRRKENVDNVNNNHLENNRVANNVNENNPREIVRDQNVQNPNHFGQKLNNQQRDRDRSHPSDQVSATEKTIFYEEELPGFSELNYPETQNNHHPATIISNHVHPTIATTLRTEKPTTTTTTERTPEVPPNSNMIENTYYPESTIHNLMPDKAGIPESACTRPGIFQHPNDCNKYYECYWDKHINKFTLHPFECPVKLAFDSRIIGCASPNDPTVCVQY